MPSEAGDQSGTQPSQEITDQPASVDGGDGIAKAEGSAFKSKVADFDVFISYRVQPDQGIAQSLKRLIENSIDPSPKVFVSGVGGLKVSAIGFKTQIQRAVQTAKVMIGVITDHSKQREWIFYEAGAAFGRGIVYAPVVFDVSLGDLPSSVADYQATDFRNEEAVQALVSTIAEELGSDSRRQFKKRYGQFLEAIKGEAADGEAKGMEDDPFEIGMQEIADLVKSGNKTGAKEKADSLLQRCTDEKKKKSLRVRTAVQLADKGGEIEALEGLPPEVKDCAEYHLYSHIHLRDFRPQRAEACLQRYLTSVGRLETEPYGTLGRVRAHVDLNQVGNAGALLRSLLASEKQEARRIAADYIASNEFGGMSFGERLLCALRGLSAYNGSLLRSIGALVHDNKMYSVSGYCFKKICAEEPNGSAFHRYGMSLQEMGLLSLAYDSYGTAERMGLTVSVATKASLFDSGKVAAHGVRILADHNAGFADAASKAYPHGVWRDLEMSVEREAGEWKAIANDSYRSLLSMVEAADAVIEGESGQCIQCDNGVSLGGEKYKVDCTGSIVESGSLLMPEFTGLTKGVVLDDCYFGVRNAKFVIVKNVAPLAVVFSVQWTERSVQVAKHEEMTVVKLEPKKSAPVGLLGQWPLVSM